MTDLEKIKKLERNIQILTRDILDIDKMIERYATCKSKKLEDAAEHLFAFRQIVIDKQTQLNQQYVDLMFEKEDDCLQDYCEVLA